MKHGKRDEALKKARRNLTIALLIGPIVPLITIAFMYAAFTYTARLSLSLRFLITTASAFLGFGLGSFIVWKLLMVLTR